MRSVVEPPIWKRPETLMLAKDVGKYTLLGLVLLYIFLAFLRPMLRKLSSSIKTATAPKEVVDEDDAIVNLSEKGKIKQERGYEENLGAAKQMAKQDPKIVANVIKGWVDE